MKLKIDISRNANFILALLLLHFVFFGFLCNIFQKDIGIRILFLYQVLFSFENFSFLSTIILFIIVFLMAFRETFFEYGIKNSIWLIPAIIIQSWIWYWFIEGFDILIIFLYFARIESYITILSLLGIILLAAVLGVVSKIKYQEYMKRIKEVEV
ncbi:MAG: hypothetical protein ACFE85_15060 [Candidatus Hodarchaeota archaeon]